MNSKQPVRPSLFAVLRFSLRSQVRRWFFVEEKNAPDSDFGSRSPAQSPLSDLVDSLCGWVGGGWYTGYGGCCFFLVVKPLVDILLRLF